MRLEKKGSTEIMFENDMRPNTLYVNLKLQISLKFQYFLIYKTVCVIDNVVIEAGQCMWHSHGTGRSMECRAESPEPTLAALGF